MTESEWRVSPYPDPMLEFLRGKGWQRKLRLFACACCRRVWDLLVDQRSRHLVELAEEYADGLTDHQSLVQARDRNYEFIRMIRPHTAHSLAAHAATAAAGDGAWAAAWNVVSEVRGAARRHTPGREHSEAAAQAKLLRHLIHNPFRPAVVDPSCLRWNGGTVVKLAQAIYDWQAFEHLPVLADALEEAGCTNAEIPEHCRVPGEHVRGCWVVDLVLQKR